MTPAWTCVRLERELGGRPVLRNVSLSVSRGQVVVLVGANGAGKTTLINVSVGLLRPTSGHCEVDGVPSSSSRSRRRVGHVPQEPVFYEDLTVWEHLVFIAKLHRLRNWQSGAHTLLADFGLGGLGDSLPSALSGGQRRRLSIVLELVRAPSMLFLDEPFNALDEAGKGIVKGYLSRLRDRGGLTVLSCHDPDGMLDLADAYVFMAHGEVVDMVPAAGFRGTSRHAVSAHAQSCQRPA